MYTLLYKRLQNFAQHDIKTPLRGSLTGLEKESLRVDVNGHIAQTPHPKILGSALKNPWITTDYAEALLELITPPCERAYKSLDFLKDIESFVYQKLDDELLWTSSMPCIIRGEDDIQIAEYGDSNGGKMKHVYRQGLAWRYGKMMQVIAGIHFNHSVGKGFWPIYQQSEGREASEAQDFINEHYMGMTRNIQRYGWMIPYLFGASPAICKSFLRGIPKLDSMKVYKENTYYEPWGTSLRMGDIGYTNRKENKAGIKASYNTMEQYIASLRCAISTPHNAYKEIGVKVDGEYRQLNSNLLQIENEYYSTVRPKQILEAFEKPVDALKSRGIRYVELRSVDINPFYPAGIAHKQLFFLEVFMLFCLLQESPPIDKKEQQEIDENQSLVAHFGRKPKLELSQNNNKKTLKSWASELLDAMMPVAELLNTVHIDTCYVSALKHQMELVEHPELTFSARVLDDLMTKHSSYFDFAQYQSNKHRDYFLKRKLSADLLQQFSQQAEQSIHEQQQVEANEDKSFDEFLKHYFNENPK
ncbi:MAG: glutamate--cysteine ligase [Aquificaceae bacterium]|nr:MAG: glutamate--cysteine ligase [Aquificaceae bacterium]